MAIPCSHARKSRSYQTTILLRLVIPNARVPAYGQATILAEPDRAGLAGEARCLAGRRAAGRNRRRAPIVSAARAGGRLNYLLESALPCIVASTPQQAKMLPKGGLA